MHHLRKLFSAALVSAVMLFLTAVSGYAQGTVTHVVKRGETIESIADRYGTTADTIQRLNPDASEFVYVGMELKIPAVKTRPNAAPEEQHASDMENQAADSGGIIQKSASRDQTQGRFYNGLIGVMECGFGLPRKEDILTSAYVFSLGFGINYFFSKFYCGGQLGFATGIFSYDFKYYEDGADSPKNAVRSQDAWSLTLPVECGYALGSDKFAVIPTCGIGFELPVKSVTKTTCLGREIDKEKHSGGKLAAVLRLGLRLSFRGFNVSTIYIVPINETGGKAYPMFSLGFGF